MLLDAAELAGLRVLSMVSQNTASAVAYGVDRLDETEHVALFINLGSSNLEMTLARFIHTGDSKKTETIEILDETSVKNVGGRSVDLAIIDLLVNHFNGLDARKGKEDIRGKPRVMKRLLKEVGPYKEILSANKEVHIKIPEVADYIDLEMTLTREMLEH